MSNLTNNNQSFYAHGKLLLSGEYLVLDGAVALAVPLNKGQKMEVRKNTSAGLIWKASHPGGDWFNAVFDHSLTIQKSSNLLLAQKLQKILLEAIQLADKMPDFFNGIAVNTHLEFDPQWGWGSSSTLISNLAEWLTINPYKLLANTFGGSGYDIACARAKGPIFYGLKNKPGIKPVTFSPPFKDQLWVVFLNKKQNSARAVATHLKKPEKPVDLIEKISSISVKMTTEKSPGKFMDLMNEHENIISDFSGLPPVKKQLFNDFHGAVKSLGAWGGDFVLAFAQRSDEETIKYFQTKGFDVLFKLEEIMINNNNAG